MISQTDPSDTQILKDSKIDASNDSLSSICIVLSILQKPVSISYKSPRVIHCPTRGFQKNAGRSNVRCTPVQMHIPIMFPRNLNKLRSYADYLLGQITNFSFPIFSFDLLLGLGIRIFSSFDLMLLSSFIGGCNSEEISAKNYL